MFVHIQNFIDMVRYCILNCCVYFWIHKSGSFIPSQTDIKIAHSEDCAVWVKACEKMFFLTAVVLWQKQRRRTSDNKLFFMRFHLQTTNHWNRFTQPNVSVHVHQCVKHCGISGCFTKWHLSTHGLHTQTDTWPVDPRYTNSSLSVLETQTKHRDLTLMQTPGLRLHKQKQFHELSTSWQGSKVFTGKNKQKKEEKSCKIGISNVCFCGLWCNF